MMGGAPFLLARPDTGAGHGASARPFFGEAAGFPGLGAEKWRP